LVLSTKSKHYFETFCRNFYFDKSTKILSICHQDITANRDCVIVIFCAWLIFLTSWKKLKLATVSSSERLQRNLIGNRKKEKNRKYFWRKTKNPNVSLPFCSIPLAHSSCISFVYAFGIIKEKTFFLIITFEPKNQVLTWNNFQKR
jgi:hypothetical protein